jgi:hypothetical protein
MQLALGFSHKKLIYKVVFVLLLGIAMWLLAVPNKIPMRLFKPGEAAAHFDKHGKEIPEKFGL